MMNGKKPYEVMPVQNGQKGDLASKGKTTIYRLVRDGHWVVLMLIRDNGWNPVEGAEYELKLENFKDTMVKARVMSFTRTGGELEVRLDVQSSVIPVLYIRTCTGVLGDSVSSLTVPAKAIYTDQRGEGPDDPGSDGWGASVRRCAARGVAEQLKALAVKAYQ